MGFISQLENCSKKNNSLLCVGLDIDLNKVPPHLKSKKNGIFHFNKMIIDSTHDLVCAYKPNFAFYEALGLDGLKALHDTIRYLKQTYPGIPVIADAKRGDIGSTAEKYAESIFTYYDCDAITVHPYLGLDSIEPFLTYTEKGVIVLCHTSNPSAAEFQDLLIGKKPLYVTVAKAVAKWHTEYENCLLVVGATWPEQMKAVRKVAPSLIILVPGIGAQGGDLEKILKAGLRKDRSGLIITASRSIIYASNGEDFARRARDETLILRDTINEYR